MRALSYSRMTINLRLRPQTAILTAVRLCGKSSADSWLCRKDSSASVDNAGQVTRRGGGETTSCFLMWTQHKRCLSTSAGPVANSLHRTLKGSLELPSSLKCTSQRSFLLSSDTNQKKLSSASHFLRWMKRGSELGIAPACGGLESLMKSFATQYIPKLTLKAIWERSLTSCRLAQWTRPLFFPCSGLHFSLFLCLYSSGKSHSLLLYVTKPYFAQNLCFISTTQTFCT